MTINRKLLIVLSIVAGVMLGIYFFQSSQTPATAVTQTFRVSPFDCAACERKIAQKLSDMSGVLRYTVREKDEAVDVTFDADVLRDVDILLAFRDLGFTAERPQAVSPIKVLDYKITFN